MTDIENTQTADKFGMLVESMAVGSEAFILGQEARGATQVRESDYLPTEGDWDKFLALGGTRGEVKPGDELFTAATLPEGWTKEGTGHSLWTDVVDERGVKRIAIGYKAAFYDRWARFTVLDVGAEVGATMRFGDDDSVPPTLPEFWDKLTIGEQKDVENYLTKRIAEDRDYAERYGDSTGYKATYVARAEAALKLVRDSRG